MLKEKFYKVIEARLIIQGYGHEQAEQILSWLFFVIWGMEV